MATVDIKTAALILDRALIEAAPVEDEIAAIIATVLRGTHKTYRYILVNALLAKATNQKVDALSLQKGDGKGGKFDARTLCHKVIVPLKSSNCPDVSAILTSLSLISPLALFHFLLTMPSVQVKIRKPSRI